jgi:hypothetical protein
VTAQVFVKRQKLVSRHLRENIYLTGSKLRKKRDVDMDPDHSIKKKIVRKTWIPTVL